MENIKYHRILLIIIGLITVTILLFYIETFGTFLSPNKDDWGIFGDYIGGILGTVFSGLTVYLIYITYEAQKMQLDLQSKESFIRYIDLQYDQIIKDINDISFKNKRGIEAIYAWDKTHKKNNNNVVNTLNFILHTFIIHINSIQSFKKLEEEVKENFYCRAYLMAHSKIIWPVLAKLYDDKAFQKHTDNLYINFNNLIKETYGYLVPKHKLLSPTDQRIKTLLANDK